MSTIVNLEIQIAPAHLDDAPRVINETLVATRAWQGNESIEVLVDDADPCHVLIVETWATTQDHADYAAWRLTPEGKSGLGDILAAVPTKEIFSARIALDK